MVFNRNRYDTLVLLVKDELAEKNRDVARLLLECLTSCTLHPIVAYNRLEHLSLLDHSKLLLAFSYFSHCIGCQLALHFFHGVAHGEKWPRRVNGVITWHSSMPGSRSIWRRYSDDSKPLPTQEENNTRAALIELARYIHIDFGTTSHKANGSTKSKNLLKHSPVLGTTLMHEVAHAWWNAVYGSFDRERFFETFPHKEIGLAQEWFLSRGSFFVSPAGELAIRRLSSAEVSMAYQQTTGQSTPQCEIATGELVRRVDDDDLRRLFDPDFWNKHLRSDPLALRKLVGE